MKWDKFAGICSAILGFLISLVGGWTPSLTVLVLFSVSDYVTGLIVAFTGKSDKTEKGGVSSRAGFKGIIRKGCIFFVIMVAYQLEVLIGLERNSISQAVMYMFIANEGISILENTSKLGVIRIPFLMKTLEQLQKSSCELNEISVNDGLITEDQVHRDIDTE